MGMLPTIIVLESSEMCVQNFCSLAAVRFGFMMLFWTTLTSHLTHYRSFVDGFSRSYDPTGDGNKQPILLTN